MNYLRTLSNVRFIRRQSKIEIGEMVRTCVEKCDANGFIEPSHWQAICMRAIQCVFYGP